MHRFLISLTAAFAAALLAPTAGHTAAPNIVLIVADDLGWNDVGYHGGRVRTPRIDQLAFEGVELDRFYVCPVCSPTRSGLMTGRYPNRFGLHNDVIPPWRDFGLATDEQCLPQLLAAAGYDRRACIGKWHLGHSRRSYHPLSRGFTDFYGHLNGAIDYFTHLREGELDWHRGFDACRDEGYSTTLLADEAVRFIEASSSEKPYFVYLPFNAPHSPLQAEEDQLARFGFDPGKPRFGRNNNREGFGEQGRGNTKRQTYRAMVAALDESIGRVLDAVEATGDADNTLVWFLSDNGGTPQHGGNNKPLRGAKGSVWEGGVRVPSVIRWPAAIEGGRQFESLAAYVDVLPTLLAATGGGPTPKNEIDGANLLPMLADQAPAGQRSLYLGRRAVVTREWKLKGDELFHVSVDPNETADVAADHPEVVKELREDLARYEALTSDMQNLPYGAGHEGFVAPKNWNIERE
ncbi:Arylsulfatase [Posidoniimonas polymericola]|uniref:Arylsulfatase n=1 Tax=Posidoniimonas polymericola TaxID=2528002 RepID=A0A5C5ZEC4_9BACT|nr:arylsulfatase [Posidoniimonas polymericola]TWT85506.1 Arylsulfatase [Posidoniimonas polymericola]